jgi:outer membrane lipoprotein SlyB
VWCVVAAAAGAAAGAADGVGLHGALHRLVSVNFAVW